MPSQITTLTIVYPTVYSGAHQRKHQKLRVTGLCAGIYWCPVNSPHKWPVTRKMFPLDDVIMCYKIHTTAWLNIKLYTSQLPKLPKLTQRTHDAIITLFLLGSVISYIKNRKYKDYVYRKMLVQEYLKKWRIFKRVKPKNDMMFHDIYNCICQNTKK